MVELTSATKYHRRVRVLGLPKEPGHPKETPFIDLPKTNGLELAQASCSGSST